VFTHHRSVVATTTLARPARHPAGTELVRCLVQDEDKVSSLIGRG